MNEIEFIEGMIKMLRVLKSDILKKEKLSQKAFDLGLNASPNQIQKANTNLNWQCMSVDKQKTSIARAFTGSCLDVGTEKKEYNPSGFHSYKG